jgi:hypothetical protein
MLKVDLKPGLEIAIGKYSFLAKKLGRAIVIGVDWGWEKQDGKNVPVQGASHTGIAVAKPPRIHSPIREWKPEIIPFRAILCTWAERETLKQQECLLQRARDEAKQRYNKAIIEAAEKKMGAEARTVQDERGAIFVSFKLKDIAHLIDGTIHTCKGCSYFQLGAQGRTCTAVPRQDPLAYPFITPPWCPKL